MPNPSRPTQNTRETPEWGNPRKGGNSLKNTGGVPSANETPDQFIVEDAGSDPESMPFVERSDRFWRDEKPLK